MQRRPGLEAFFFYAKSESGFHSSLFHIICPALQYHATVLLFHRMPWNYRSIAIDHEGIAMNHQGLAMACHDM